MERLIDLHTHSVCSDGSMTPRELVAHAAREGIAAIALSDHDCVDGVAEAMAEGVRRITGADFAVSVTGVAGPDRDDRGNEVGTVFIGIASDGIVTHEKLQLDGDRAGIRNVATNVAFLLLLHTVQGKYPTT